jgi:cell division protein FtsX
MTTARHKNSHIEELWGGENDHHPATPSTKIASDPWRATATIATTTIQQLLLPVLLLLLLLLQQAARTATAAKEDQQQQKKTNSNNNKQYHDTCQFHDLLNG